MGEQGPGDHGKEAAEQKSNKERKILLLTNSRRSQSEKLLASWGRETAVKRVKNPRNKKSQAHTTNGTRARGRREPGKSPDPAPGPCAVADRRVLGSKWVRNTFATRTSATFASKV